MASAAASRTLAASLASSERIVGFEVASCTEAGGRRQASGLCVEAGLNVRLRRHLARMRPDSMEHALKNTGSVLAMPEVALDGASTKWRSAANPGEAGRKSKNKQVVLANR